MEGAFETRVLLLRAGIDALEWGDVDRGQRPGHHPDDEVPQFLTSRVAKFCKFIDGGGFLPTQRGP